MIDQHVASGRRRHRGRHPGAAQGGDRVRGDRDRRGRPQDHGVPGEAGRPAGRPAQPDEAYASMGNYVFSTDVLVDALHKDAADDESRHDMGGDIIPMLVREGAAEVYDFLDNEVPGDGPRTPGTGATWGRSTPISTRTWTCARSSRCSTCTTTGGRSSPSVPSQPPAKFVHDERRPGRPRDQQHRQQRGDRLRRPRPRRGALARASASTAGPGSSGPCCCTTPGSAGMPWSRTRSWTRTCVVPEGSRSA